MGFRVLRFTAFTLRAVVFGFAASALLLPSFTWAQSREAAPTVVQEPDVVIPRSKSHVDFSDVKIEGETQKPAGEYTLSAPEHSFKCDIRKLSINKWKLCMAQENSRQELPPIAKTVTDSLLRRGKCPETIGDNEKLKQLAHEWQAGNSGPIDLTPFLVRPIDPLSPSFEWGLPTMCGYNSLLRFTGRSHFYCQDTKKCFHQSNPRARKDSTLHYYDEQNRIWSTETYNRLSIFEGKSAVVSGNAGPHSLMIPVSDDVTLFFNSGSPSMHHAHYVGVISAIHPGTYLRKACQLEQEVEDAGADLPAAVRDEATKDIQLLIQKSLDIRRLREIDELILPLFYEHALLDDEAEERLNFHEGHRFRNTNDLPQPRFEQLIYEKEKRLARLKMKTGIDAYGKAPQFFSTVDHPACGAYADYLFDRKKRIGNAIVPGTDAKVSTQKQKIEIEGTETPDPTLRQSEPQDRTGSGAGSGAISPVRGAE